MSVRLFGTDGIRGIANTELTPELAMRIGEAVCHFLGDRGACRVVVGRDTRRSGEMLEAALVAGITAGGGEALLCGVVPTPTVALLVRELGADGGVVISASHNPPEYNGLKIFSREGLKLPDELEDEIETYCLDTIARERPSGADIGVTHDVDNALERYIAHACESVSRRFDGLRVAVDCGHGASFRATQEAFERLGATVVALNCDFDGMDINVGCGSTDLGPLKALVRQGGFDFGIAHDGDADRVLAVDDLGNEVDGDQIMAVCAVSLAQRDRLPNNTVISTVMCNLGFEVAMREQGIAVVKTKVGDRYVLEQMLSMGATLGGEQSGHIIFLEHNTTGDGLVTALQLAEVVANAEKPLSELVTVMTRYPQILVNVHVADRTRLAASAAIFAAVHESEAELGETGRVLVRASGTEPVVRVMAEAADAVAAKAVVDRLVAIVSRELS